MVGILSSLLGSIVVVSGTLFFALLCVITHEFVVGYLKNKNNYKKKSCTSYLRCVYYPFAQGTKCYLFERALHSAGWSSLVARRAHNPKVVGSNPAPATKMFQQVRTAKVLACFVFLCWVSCFRAQETTRGLVAGTSMRA